MIKQLVSYIKSWWRELVQSKIAYHSISLKDKELDKQFMKQHRDSVRQRARSYCVLLLALLLISTAYFAIQKQVAYFLLACYGATLISLFLCDFVCRFSMYGTDMMMLLNVILRGVAIYAVTQPVAGIECIEPIFKLVTYYMSTLLTVCDLLLLRTNTYIAFFINIPVFFISASLNGQERESIYER